MTLPDLPGWHDPMPGSAWARTSTVRIVVPPFHAAPEAAGRVSWHMPGVPSEVFNAEIATWRRWARTSPKARDVSDKHVDACLAALKIDTGPALAKVMEAVERRRAADQLRAARASVAGAILALAHDKAREVSPMPDPVADPDGYADEMQRDVERNRARMARDSHAAMDALDAGIKTPRVLGAPGPLQPGSVLRGAVPIEFGRAVDLFPDAPLPAPAGDGFAGVSDLVERFGADRIRALLEADEKRRAEPGRQHKARAGGTLTTTLALDWQTPEEYLRPVRAVLTGDPLLPIPLDVATAPDNPTGAARFYAPPESDGLVLPWDAPWFCNPPYGNQIRRWFLRVLDQVRNGLPGLVFIPAGRWEMPYLHDLVRAAPVVCFVRGRVAFRRPETGDRPRANVGGSMFLGFNVDPLVMAVEMSPGCRTSCRPKRGRRRKLAPVGPLFEGTSPPEPEDTRPEGDWFGGLVLELAPADGGPRIQLRECVTCGDLPCAGRDDPRSHPHPDGPCCACCPVLASTPDERARTADPPETGPEDPEPDPRIDQAIEGVRGIKLIGVDLGREVPGATVWAQLASAQEAGEPVRVETGPGVIIAMGLDGPVLAPCGCHIVRCPDAAGRPLDLVEHVAGCTAMQHVTAGPEGQALVRELERAAEEVARPIERMRQLPGPEAMLGYADQFGGEDYPHA